MVNVYTCTLCNNTWGLDDVQAAKKSRDTYICPPCDWLPLPEKKIKEDNPCIQVLHRPDGTSDYPPLEKPLYATLRQYKFEGNKAMRIDMTWEQVHESFEDMKKDFRERNMTDGVLSAGLTDNAYDEYCESIQTFLDTVALDNIPKQYRIAEAKRRREKGIFHDWTKQET